MKVCQQWTVKSDECTSVSCCVQCTRVYNFWRNIEGRCPAKVVVCTYIAKKASVYALSRGTNSGSIKCWQMRHNGGLARLNPVHRIWKSVPWVRSCRVKYNRYVDHNHMPRMLSAARLVRQRVSNSVKRRVVDDVCERSRKIIREQMNREAIETPTPKDILHTYAKICTEPDTKRIPVPKTLQE